MGRMWDLQEQKTRKTTVSLANKPTPQFKGEVCPESHSLVSPLDELSLKGLGLFEDAADV